MSSINPNVPEVGGILLNEARPLRREIRIRENRAHRAFVDAQATIDFTEVAPEEPALEATPFTSDELVVIAPPNHSLLKKRRVTPERFCQEPIVVRATGSDTKSFVERALVQRGLVIKPVLSLGSTEAIKRAVAAGIGVAIVSSLAIGLELKARTLAVVKLSGPPIRRPLYRVAHRGRTVSAALKAFLAMMAAHAAQLNDK